MSLFPITPSGRQIFDGNGSEFLIFGRTAWGLASLTPSLQLAFLDDCQAHGYNAIEIQAPCHLPLINNKPFDGSGNTPFLKTLSGATWSGTLTYGTINNEAPDFSTPNPAYWATMDTLIAAAASRNILVGDFPLYLGQGGADGWVDEGNANIAVKGDAAVSGFGAFYANRYKSAANMFWLTAGDTGGGFDVENALITGIQSVSGQASGLNFSSERGGGSISTDGSGALGLSTTINGAYDWRTVVGQCRRAQSYSTRIIPAFNIEQPYDEEGPDGTNVNTFATQPVRRYAYWALLNAVNGFFYGNGYVWRFALSGSPPVSDDYRLHLNTQMTQDLSRLFAFAKSWPSWSNLQPSGLNGMATLVTSGGGTVPDGTATDDQSYVASAVSADGNRQFAYFPPAPGRTAGTPATVTLAQMANKPIRARWFSPTSGNFSTNASAPGTFTYNNSMTAQVFTPPTSITPDGDALLVLDTASPSISTGITYWCG